jgi:multidrug resistance efflux pump
LGFRSPFRTPEQPIGAAAIAARCFKVTDGKRRAFVRARGHVKSIARAINVANAPPNGQGVATVDPIFTWVRLAQRIPVRIQIDRVPEGVVLVAGMTATVQTDDPRPHRRNRSSRPPGTAGASTPHRPERSG